QFGGRLRHSAAMYIPEFACLLLARSFFFSSRRRHTRFSRDWSSDVCSSDLQGSLDFFEGVPVVSFGWVALFILIYIVLIGPVDYLFLKKVVKRLEWTWVTFPEIGRASCRERV